MSKLEKKVVELQKEIRDMQAFLGVLLPVFEKEYKRGKWNFSKK